MNSEDEILGKGIAELEYILENHEFQMMALVMLRVTGVIFAEDVPDLIDEKLLQIFWLKNEYFTQPVPCVRFTTKGRKLAESLRKASGKENKAERSDPYLNDPDEQPDDRWMMHDKRFKREISEGRLERLKERYDFDYSPTLGAARS